MEGIVSRNISAYRMLPMRNVLRVETGGSEVQNHPELHSESEASLDSLKKQQLKERRKEKKGDRKKERS